MNRVIQDMLRNFVNYHQDDWDEHLGTVEFAYNNAVQTSTGFSPFYLDTGKDPIVPSNLITMDKEPRSNVESVENFIQRQDLVLREAKDNLKLALSRQEEQANKKRRPELSWKVGDKVMLNVKNITHPPDKQRPKRKLLNKFQGPFEIKKIISPVNYELALPKGMKVHPVFHTDLLKAFEPNPAEFVNRDPPKPFPVLTEANEVEWEVEEVLDKAQKGKNVQYLVKWKGYALHDATWERAENLKNASKLVAKYEKKHRKA
jgi:hypothetical protein